MTESNDNDEDVQRDVMDELHWDPRIASTSIGVAVNQGVVVLTGYVDSFYKRHVAEEAAYRVRGVNAVANEIEVKLPMGAERTDEEIAGSALHALAADSLLSDNDIKVTVSRGWVTLKGEVEWNFLKLDAERAVRRLWGVKGVTNLISVTPKPTPAELQRKIEDALKRRAELDAKSITVDIQGSTAILRGKVHSWAERQEAERAAWAPGITQVVDQIQISYT